MSNVILELPKPQPKQEMFLKARKKYIGFGGARGGGKSFAVRIKSILLALKHGGIRILIVRRTFPELKRNHIEPMRKLLYPLIKEKKVKYNQTDKMFRFFNDSIIEFMYCENETDTDRLQGAEYDVIFIDEATQLLEKQIKDIAVCVRGVNNFPKHVYFTCNPGGRGHGYIKRIFIDKKYLSGEKPEEYEFIQSKVSDNKALMTFQPDYVAQLEALPPKRRRAWLDGDWDVYEGQFFDDFVNDPDHYGDGLYTHVIEPFAPPKRWQIYRSYDFGYGKPFSCGWWAVDEEGVMYRIHEYYGCEKDEENVGVKMTPDQQFREISKIEQTHKWLKGKNIYGIADPSIWDGSRGESVAETAEKYGVYFEPGDNARVAGWMQCHYRLQFDHNGFPMMYVFNTCEAFIRTIPVLISSDTNPEDLDTTMEDHVADEWRYMCMSRPITPPESTLKEIPADNPLNLYH